MRARYARFYRVPHPSLRDTFPKGKAIVCNGFPERRLYVRGYGNGDGKLLISKRLSRAILICW